MLNKKISNEEALSGAMEQIAEIISFFHQEDGMSESELDDIWITATNLSEVIAASLSLDIVSVDDSGVVTATFKLSDVESLLRELLSQ